MSLRSINGIGPATEAKLEAVGITAVAKLADADAASLAAQTGVPERRLRAFIDRAGAEPNAEPEANGEPTLLSGGNPQIPKGDGDAPVQAYIAAMPGWKRDVGRRLDELIKRVVPDVRKAVRWNSPFYGVAGQGWFLSYHCFTNYVKVTFLRGSSLEPLPPVESKHEETRYVHIHENDQLDEALFESWIRQASALPGDPLFYGNRLPPSEAARVDRSRPPAPVGVPQAKRHELPTNYFRSNSLESSGESPHEPLRRWICSAGPDRQD